MPSYFIARDTRHPLEGAFPGSTVGVITSLESNNIPYFSGVNTLQPGAVISPHWHADHDELQIILSGSGQAYLNGVVVDVGIGDAIFSAGDRTGIHGFRASSECALSILFIYPNGTGERPGIETVELSLLQWRTDSVSGDSQE